MRRLTVFFTVILFAFALFGCDSPDPDESIVKLDGPILEVQTGNGTVEFNGSVINTADYSVKSVYVVIILNDEDGNIIESKSVLLDEGIDNIMDPSEISYFTVVFNDMDPSEVFSKEVEIYYEPAN